SGVIDVIYVEHDPGYDSIFGIDLNEAKHLAVECVGPLLGAQEPGMSEEEALTSDRDDIKHHVPDADVSPRAHIFDIDVSTYLDSRANNATTIVTREVVSSHLGHRSPVACREVR